MGPIDFAIIVIIAVIMGSACIYIHKAKKSGKKCIGCPEGGSCNKCNCDCNSNK